MGKRLTCAFTSALSGAGTARGFFVKVVLSSEASRGASVPAMPLLPGKACLIPACVRVEAEAVVGVVVPEDSGEMAAGAIVSALEVVVVVVGSEVQISSVDLV